MATENDVRSITLPAAADLSTKQFYGVEINSSGQVSVNNAAGEFCIGVLQNKPSAAGRAATVAYSGITKVVAGSGGLDEGDLVKVASDGTFVVAVKGKTDTSDTGGASDPLVGSHVFGVCVKAAAEAGLASVLILQAGAVPTTAA